MYTNEEGLQPSRAPAVRLAELAPQFESNSQPKYRSTNGNDGPIMEYWQLLKRRKLLLFIGAVLGASVAFVDLVLQEPVYGSGTTLEIQGVNESFMGMNNVDPQANTGNYAVTTSNINTQLRVIESGSIRGPVMDRLRRETAPMSPPTGGTLGRLRSRLRRSKDDPLQEMRKGLAMAGGTLHARSILGTRILLIQCDSTIPEIAASFVNSVAQEYIAHNAQQRSVNYQKTAQWLDTQVEETKVKLEQAENNLQEFTRQSGAAFVGDAKETLADTKLRALQMEIAGIQSDRIAKQQKYDQIKATSAEGMSDLIEDGAYKLYQSKLADLKQEMAKLRLTLTVANPKVLRVQQQIDETLAAMQKEKDLTLERIKGDYESSLARERMLSKEYSTQAGAISAQTGKVAQFAQLKREVDLYQTQLNAMLAQENQITIVSAIPANNVSVVDAAVPPNIPYKPNAMNYETYGVLMGCGAAMALAIAIQKFTKWRTSLTFAAPGYAPSILNVPELGVIPSATIDLLPQDTSSRWKWNKLPLTARTTVAAAKPVELEISKRQRSFLAESFRLTLTSILMMSRRGLQPKVMVVTSPNPGEGKTTVASNMAIAIAESGRKVLLIDADLRRPQLHSIFGMDKTMGFADLITHTSGNGLDAGGPTVCETQIPNIFLLPSGSGESANLSQVFHSAEIPILLKRLSGRFDLILIDTPPMLQFSDARLIARFADGVILVVRSGMTGCESAVIAREQLAQDHIEVLGTILNDWDARNSKKHAYHAYYSAVGPDQKQSTQA